MEKLTSPDKKSAASQRHSGSAVPCPNRRSGLHRYLFPEPLLIVTLLCSGLALSSCSNALRLDTSSAGSARAAALDTSGGIHGEVIDGKACFWITVTGGQDVSLVWPPGSVAKDDPLRVEDASGRVLVAADAKDIQISGHVEDGAGCRPNSRRFIVGEVER